MQGKQSVERLALTQALDPLAGLFPAVSSEEVWAVLALIPLGENSRLATSNRGEERPLLSLTNSAVHLTTWQGVRLAIPYRGYFQEPSPTIEQQLTSRQRQLLACLYLRHHDGFVRHRRLAQLFREEELAALAIPFTFSLPGDYVQAILEVLVAHLTPALLASCVELISEYYRTGRRGAPQFRPYVGSRLLKKLREAVRRAALT